MVTSGYLCLLVVTYDIYTWVIVISEQLPNSQILCNIRDFCMSKKLYIALYLSPCLWLLVWRCCYLYFPLRISV